MCGGYASWWVCGKCAQNNCDSTTGDRRWATKLTTMAMERRDTMMTMMATDVDVDNDGDDNNNDNTSSTTSNEGDNHQGRQSQLQQWLRHLRINGKRLRIGNGNDTVSNEAAAHHEAEAARGREVAAVRQVGPCKLRQPDGEDEVKAKLRGGGGGGATTGATQQPAGKQEVSRRGGVQEVNGRGGVRAREVAAARREALRQPAGGTSFPPAGMAVPLTRSLATAAAAMSHASSMSSALAKSVNPLPSASTPLHRRRRRPRWTRSAPFWGRQRPDHHPNCNRRLVRDEQEVNGRWRQWRRW